jgi:hypothetical protein
MNTISTLPENNQQIFASKYEVILPSKAQLKMVIEGEEERQGLK